jgi:hypothetical protein
MNDPMAHNPDAAQAPVVHKHCRDDISVKAGSL